MSMVKDLFFLSRPKALATMPDMYDLRGAMSVYWKIWWLEVVTMD
jgi:hypothetical protein